MLRRRIPDGALRGCGTGSIKNVVRVFRVRVASIYRPQKSLPVSLSTAPTTRDQVRAKSDGHFHRPGFSAPLIDLSERCRNVYRFRWHHFPRSWTPVYARDVPCLKVFAGKLAETW